MPWHLDSNNPKCSGWAVVKDADGSVAGCHKTKAEAQAQMAALYANVKGAFMDESDDAHYETRAVDNSAWDGNAAMGACDDAACYRAICAGKTAGDPALRGSWKLPHHKSPGSPPNASGVRNALARFAQTQGLTNKAAARAHLDRHMASIQAQSESATHQIDPTQTVIEIEGRTISLASWVEACDEARERHVLKVPFPLVGIEVTESRGRDGGFNIKGHASVFGQTSLDLGGFREQVSHGFFQQVLDRQPDVHAVWDHDTRLTLARTRNSTLELREDDIGLYNFIKVAPTSYAQDLRILMERGDIDQQSFAFTVEDDRYESDDEGNILRTLVRAKDLFDVTITAQGAYPQTAAEVSRSVRSMLDLDRKFFAVSKVGDGAARQAPAVDQPADGAAEERQAVSEVEASDFFMWKAAMEKKAAARMSKLAKLAEMLEKMEN